MKRLVLLSALIGLFFGAGVVLIVEAQAQDLRPAMKLLDYTFDLDHSALCWHVFLGHLDANDDFHEDSISEPYCVDPDNGTMSHQGETRGFDADSAEHEKAILHDTLDVLTRYAEASTEWWREGHGVKIQPDDSKTRKAKL